MRSAGLAEAGFAGHTIRAGKPAVIEIFSSPRYRSQLMNSFFAFYTAAARMAGKQPVLWRVCKDRVVKVVRLLGG